ncbi:hypothetical protein F2Q68_00000567, partial [Brassica cretica]
LPVSVVLLEKVEILSSELTRLKTLLDSSESEMVGKLEEEIDVLKRDLERARSFESEVKEQEMIIKKLNADLEAANSSSEEWKSKAKEVESQLQEANNLERCASLSLESVMKQLEGSNDKLHETESEITNLKDQIMTLETTITRQKEDLEESEEELSKTKKEAEKLKKELETVVKEKNRALDKEQDASSNVQRLLEQRKKLLSDLEASKEEEEKSKKAMETLASALHEVSSEGRELKEKLLSQGGGDQEYEAQIEDLKLVIKAASEKYEAMLDEARHEIDVLVSAVEQTKKHFESSKTEWEMKEAKLVDHVRKMEEEVASMSRLDGLLKRTEEEADAAWKKEAETKESLKEVEDEVVYLQECLGEARDESVKLKESLLEKESEFESVVHENEELRVKEGVALRKIEELSKFLEEARLSKEEVEVSESEKEYDLLPKVVEFSSENGHGSVEERSPEVITTDEEDPQEHISNGNGNGNGMEEKDMNGKPEEAKTEMKEKKEESPDDDDDKDNSVEVIFKMWESCQVEKKEAVVPDKKAELESQGEEQDSSKIDESDKASTENVEDEVVMEKKIKKKKTLLGKVFSRRKQHKTAQLHAEKVEILSSELTRLKTLLDSSESEMVGKLEEEIDVLKRDLERARSFESEVKEQEMIIKKLNADLEAANSSSEEWKSKAKEVESQLQEANNLERCASLSLESVMKQLEGSNDKLHETESELINLKEKIMTLETTVARQKEDLKESEEQLSMTEKEVDKLKNELETVVEEKNRALDKEQDASLNVQRLLEQKKKLLADFETSKEEEEKSKKAMETLASALHEVSSEGRELKEKLLSQGGGDQEYEAQIEDLKLVIKATSEKYETMLDESRHEIDVLVSAVEQTKKHFESSKTEWEMKEAKLVDHVRKMEEEVASMSRLDGLLKRTEEEADAAWKKEAETKESLKEVEDEIVYLQECLGEAKAESMKLKESLLEKDSEFESVVHENEELRVKEGVALRKIEELSKLLEEARLRKEEVEVSESEKEYDLLPKVVEFSSENGHRSVEEKSPEVKTIEDEEDPQEHISNGNGNGMEEKDMNGKPEEAKTEMKEKKEESPDDDDDKDNSVEVIFKMWESCQVEKKEAVVPDKKAELESQGEEQDSSKIDESDKASTENVEDEVVMEKKTKKKKTLLVPNQIELEFDEGRLLLVDVTYLRLPPKCPLCNIIGHRASSCPNNKPPTPSPIVSDNVANQSNPSVVDPLATGSSDSAEATSITPIIFAANVSSNPTESDSTLAPSSGDVSHVASVLVPCSTSVEDVAPLFTGKVKPSAKAKEMQLQYTGRGRGNRGRGNRGRGSG